MNNNIIMFLLGLSLALILVFMFRKQLKPRRDAMIRTIKSWGKNKNEK